MRIGNKKPPQGVLLICAMSRDENRGAGACAGNMHVNDHGFYRYVSYVPDGAVSAFPSSRRPHSMGSLARPLSHCLEENVR